jgi:hypothetical protein
MKTVFMTVLAGTVSLFAAAQEAHTSLVSYTSSDKLAIARSSIDVPAWHEKTFWPIYEDYNEVAAGLSIRNAIVRKNLVDAANSNVPEEAATAAENLFKHDRESFANKRNYYKKLSDELNGIISLQFLQGEIVMDMMESSNAYEATALRKHKFHPSITSEEQFQKAKHNAIYKALGLTKDNDYFFWNIYHKYEEEVDNLLGEKYSLISYYAGEPTDFTPALAKRIGQDALAIIEREIKLKEKYYLQLKEEMGPVMAAKFLAWEDYYSLVSKMYAWADAP